MIIIHEECRNRNAKISILLGVNQLIFFFRFQALHIYIYIYVPIQVKYITVERTSACRCIKKLSKCNIILLLICCARHTFLRYSFTKRSLSSKKVDFTQVLLAKANRECEWPTGGTEHRLVFHPSWFHGTNGRVGFSLRGKKKEQIIL